MPDAPVSLANVAATTTASQIGLSWSDGAYDGGSSIIDYTVFGDGGTGTWTTLASNVLTTTYTATSLTANVIYSFKV